MTDIEKAVRFRDAFGNMTHLVSISGPHSEIAIIARGTIETQDKAGFVRGFTEVAPTRIFKRETVKTAPDDAIRELTANLEAPDPIDCLHELMATVGERVKYVVGATTASTSAAERLKAGRGVCQDHAHIFIFGRAPPQYPARYVNGYFVTGGHSGRSGNLVSGVEAKPAEAVDIGFRPGVLSLRSTFTAGYEVAVHVACWVAEEARGRNKNVRMILAHAAPGLRKRFGRTRGSRCRADHVLHAFRRPSPSTRAGDRWDRAPRDWPSAHGWHRRARSSRSRA